MKIEREKNMEIHKELILLLYSMLLIQQVHLIPAGITAGLRTMIPSDQKELDTGSLKSNANTALTLIENIRKKINENTDPAENIGVAAIEDLTEQQTQQTEDILQYRNLTSGEYGIEEMLRSLPDELDIAMRKRDLQAQFNRMNSNFDEFLRLWMIVSDLNFNREILGDACKFAKKYYATIPKILTEIEQMLVPTISISRNTLDLLEKDVAKNSAQICAANNSPVDYFYDLYNTTITTGVKGFFILKFSHFILTRYEEIPECNFGNGNATRQLTLFENSIKNGLEKCTKEFVRIMNHQKNITEFHTCDQNHNPEKLTEAIQVDDFILKIIFEIISFRKDLFIFLLL